MRAQKRAHLAALTVQEGKGRHTRARSRPEKSPADRKRGQRGLLAIIDLQGGRDLSRCTINRGGQRTRKKCQNSVKIFFW